jgi:sn-glycerol 3-phosphate transport system substrate-binding protein
MESRIVDRESSATARQTAPCAGVTRRRVLGAAGSTGALVLAACGGTGGTGTGGQASERLGPNGFAFKTPVQLTYWKSLEGPRHEAQVKLTDDFNASRTDVKVTLEHVGNYDQAAQKFTAALAANTTPELFLSPADTYMPGFARLGAFYPLDDFAKADKSAHLDTYVPGLLKGGVVNGKLYQVPLARSTPVMYYNKDHLRQAGLPETPPDTWDQVVEVAQKLARAGVVQPDQNDGLRIAFPVAAYSWTFQASVWALGGRLSDDKFVPTMTAPETVQATQFLADLVQRQRVARGYRTAGNSNTAFQRGELSFFLESTAQLTQTEANTSARVGAAFIPKQKQRAVPGGGSGISIVNAAPAEKREAGWEFMKFATNTKNTIYFSQMTGYLVVRADAEKDPAFQQYLKEHPNAKVTFDQMQYVRTQDSITEVPGSTGAIEDAVRAVVIDGQNARTVLDELQRKLSSLAQDARK